MGNILDRRNSGVKTAVEAGSLTAATVSPRAMMPALKDPPWVIPYLKWLETGKIDLGQKLRVTTIFEAGYNAGVSEMRDVKNTSSMMYPLEPPNGWFLLEMEHQHTKITYRGDVHVPVSDPGGPWYVVFQQYPHGGNARPGRGYTMEEAWANAAKATEKGSNDDA